MALRFRCTLQLATALAAQLPQSDVHQFEKRAVLPSHDTSSWSHAAVALLPFDSVLAVCACRLASWFQDSVLWCCHACATVLRRGIVLAMCGRCPALSSACRMHRIAVA
jgi:hypothetical protein